MQKIVITVAFTLLLAACQMAAVRDENSPHSRLALGSTITLHQTLNVPAGHSRVFLQFGEVVAKIKLDQYQPHCDFEVRSVSKGEETIRPDTFTVTKVMEDEEEVVGRQSPQHYASLDSDLSLGGGEMLPMVSRFVRHTLYSVSQPQVMRLTCHGGFDDPWEVKTPSVSEIRRVLGAIATVTLQGAI
jgi:hypothetical protein